RAAESVESILRHLQGRGLVATPFREVLVAGSDLEVALEETRGLPRLAVDARAAADVFMIGSGALAPLGGFLNEADYPSLVATGPLFSRAPLPVPVLPRPDTPAAP